MFTIELPSLIDCIVFSMMVIADSHFLITTCVDDRERNVSALMSNVNINIMRCEFTSIAVFAALNKVVEIRTTNIRLCPLQAL